VVAQGRGTRARRQGVPEVHRLGADGAVPEAGEAALLGAGGRVDVAAGIVLAEQRAEAAEDAGAGAERHGGGNGGRSGWIGGMVEGAATELTREGRDLGCHVRC
jgi:hypothetical protein